MHQRVAELAAVGASETRAAPDDLVTFSGGVFPARRGQRVVLQQLGPGGWHQIAQGSLGRGPSFSLVHSFATDGTYQLRAYMPWGADNINSYTAPVSIDVNGIHKIKHVVIIMQENRSFDQYFGTYPGADGIPGLAGNPGTVPCVPDPMNGGCVEPFHDTSDKNYGGPHGRRTRRRLDCADIDGGADGRVRRPGGAGTELHDRRPELQPVHRDVADASAST